MTDANQTRADTGAGASTGRSEYLWDRSAPVDGEVARLEELLAPLRYDKRQDNRQERWSATRSAAPGAVFALRRMPLAAAALLALAVGGAWLAAVALVPRADHTALIAMTGPGLTVRALAGTPRIGETEIAGGAARLREGEWLNTPAGASAELAVADIGHVRLDPGSRLRLVATGAREHRLALARGRIAATITAPPRLFFVETPSATAIDLGCAYTLAVDDEGNGELRVTLGMVQLERAGDAKGAVTGGVIVPRDAVCLTRAGIGPGTPFYDDASPRLQRELARFDFDSGGSAALAAVIEEARDRDSLTLWHLLARTGGADRGWVMDRLSATTLLPAGVSREAILRGDSAALERWRDVFIWSPAPPVSKLPGN